MHEVLIALGLILIIEGGLYAAFPVGMKRAMSIIQAQPNEYLRNAGFGAATAGVALIWAVDALGR